MSASNSPPSIEMLHKLQIFRTTLVNFMEWRNFSEVVTGCYVRVLLEMRGDEQLRGSNDHYYIACVKGAKKGPIYDGFSADAATTALHIIIELPPCFRSTPNSNLVQFNSISNSPFRQSEYQLWVEMTNEAKQSFPSLPQLQFRLGMLEEQKQQALKPEQPRRRKDEDPQAAAQREQTMARMREDLEKQIIATHIQQPRIDQLKVKGLDELQEIEREMLDLISTIRVAINERSKCLVCHNRVCTEICYPCKHQVLCKDCASRVRGVCPVPDCHTPVTQIFEPYTS